MAANGKEVVISVRGLVNVLGGKLIHDHVDLDVYRGEVLGIVGGSGSGKSVLLRTIVGLNKQQEGHIEVFGEDPTPHRERPENSVQMRWGVLFQEGALFSSQTVAENIQVPLREYTKMSQELMNEVTAVKLSMVGLPEDAAAKYPSELSGGMKKRAGLARALAADPGARVPRRTDGGPRSHLGQPVRRACARSSEKPQSDSVHGDSRPRHAEGHDRPHRGPGQQEDQGGDDRRTQERSRSMDTGIFFRRARPRRTCVMKRF